MSKQYDEAKKILLYLYNNNVSALEKQSLYNKYLATIRNMAYKGNSNAQYDLAQHYENFNILGYPNPCANIKKKVYWYTKATDNGHASACNNLADLYERGEGVPKNVKKGLELYKRSGKLGDVIGVKNYKIILQQIKNGFYKTEKRDN